MAGRAAEDVVEYLVLKKMAGRPEVLMALLDYINGELSPSMAYERYGVSKHQLRGFVQRIYEKSGDRFLAAAAIRAAVPIILSSVPSYVRRDGGPPECSICGEVLLIAFPEDHIRKHHSDILGSEARSIMDRVRSSARSMLSKAGVR